MAYLKEKIINLARKRFLPHLKNKAIISNAKLPIKEYDEICFYFDDPSLMHLGDQMYFIPLIKKLHETGYRISIAPTKIIQFAFKKFPAFNEKAKVKRLIVSRIELYPVIKKAFGKIDYFLCDTMSTAVDSPISNYILKTFCKHYHIQNIDQNISASDYLNFDLALNPEFEGLKDKNIIILNNYVDSGKFRISKKRAKKLLDHLTQHKKDGFVIHLGSEKDKLNDAYDYTNIVNLDLRGKTSISDIFSLLSMNNINAVYCHDTFIMHVANLFNKVIYVVFKKYLINNVQKRKAFSSLFAKKNNENVHIL